MAALGDILYRAAALWARLAGNTVASRKFLSQTGTGAVSAAPAWERIVESDIDLANNTTNNVSIAKHGFTPILPNDATKFLNGTGAYSTPTGTVPSAHATTHYDSGSDPVDITQLDGYNGSTTQFLRGDGSFASVSGSGGTSLSSITSATAANTIANGNNHSQVWNWALTSNSVDAFKFGETSAATNGTDDNQALVKIVTLAGSTAIPLYVIGGGDGGPHCFRVDDVAGDTTPFVINKDGKVGIQTLNPSADLEVRGGGLQTWSNGTFTLELQTSISAPVLYASSSHRFGLGSNNAVRVWIETAGGTTLSRGEYTSVTGADNHLRIGGGPDSLTTNDLFAIGFGPNGSHSEIPAYIAYKALATGDSRGDLVFATRPTATNVAPTVRVTIASSGETIFAGAVQTQVVTVANLPASPVHGMIISVSDSNTAVWGATIAGGGTNKVLAYYNGTNWTVMGV